MVEPGNGWVGNSNLFMNMADGFAVHEIVRNIECKAVDCRFVMVNPAFRKIMGLGPEDLTGSFAGDRLPDAYRDWMDRLSVVEGTGQPARINWRSPESGKSYDISVFRPEYGRVACIFRDITAAVSNELALERREAELTAIHETIPLSMLLVNRELEVVKLNRSATRTARRPPEDLLGIRLGEVLGCTNAMENPGRCGSLESCSLCEVRQKVADTVAGGSEHERAEVAVNLRHEDGSQRAAYLSISTSHVRGLAEPAFLVCVEDITDSRLRNEALRKVEKMETVGQLAAGIAHDFNNVLSGILGYTELTMGLVPADSLARSNLEKVMKSGHRARDLVRQILCFSSGTDNKKTDIDIGEIVSEVGQMLSASLPSSIRVEQHVSGGLETMACESQMNELVMNLATNAARAMGGRGTLTIDARSETVVDEIPGVLGPIEPARYIVLAVADTGIGIDEAGLERMFSTFYTAWPAEKGTGLGLAIVKNILLEHGGNLTVESSPGNGSRFTLYLPVRACDTAPPTKTGGMIRSGTERILFVDDEEFLVEVVIKMLSPLGYSISAFTDSNAALEHFREHHDEYDVIITDQTMPGLQGNQLAESARQLSPELPVLICSGYSRETSGDDWADGGLNGFLEKPYRLGELCTELNRLLG